MTATVFIDTNVLVYAASNAVADQPKRKIARGLLSQEQIGFSAQVLQEFYAAAVAKVRLEMSHEEALAVLQSLSAFPVIPITREPRVTSNRCEGYLHDFLLGRSHHHGGTTPRMPNNLY